MLGCTVRAGGPETSAVGTGFDDLALRHHGDGLADLAHHPQVVRDEHVCQSGIVLDLAQQVEHLSLNGDVERTGGLVAHQDLGSTGERAGDADALALPTGELDGAAMQCGRRQPDTVHQLRCPLRALTLVAHPLQPKRLADYVDGGQMRIQGPVRVLKDHLHTRSERAQRFLRQLRNIGAVDNDAPGGGSQQPHDGLGYGGLAATGFADDGHCRSAVHAEADRIDRPERTRGHRILHDEVLDGQHCLAHARTPAFVSPALHGPSTGTAASSFLVYALCGRRTSSSAPPFSTKAPSFIT